MLDGAAGLGRHDVAEAGIVRGRGPVGDGEVPPGLVAVEEDGDVVDLAGAVLAVRGQAQLAVRRNIKGDLDGVCGMTC